MKKVLVPIFLFVTIAAISLTTARYVMTKNNDPSIMQVAQPRITISDNQDVVISTENKIYNNSFKIKNVDDNGNLNEVKQKYYIEFIYNDVDPSKVELTMSRNGQNITIINNKTQEFDLNIGSEQIDSFTMTAKYTGIVTEEDLTGRVSLKLHSYQVQPEV